MKQNKYKLYITVNERKIKATFFWSFLSIFVFFENKENFFLKNN